MKEYYACKDNKGMHWRMFGGSRTGSYVLETRFLFANKFKANEFAEENSLKVVTVFLKEDVE